MWAVAAGLRGLAAGGAAGIDRAVNKDHIRLAVTGLSRAGKTMFITSLIHNLLALGQRRNTLPSLTARLTQDGINRLRSVEVLPAGASVLPVFDYGAGGQISPPTPRPGRPAPGTWPRSRSRSRLTASRP